MLVHFRFVNFEFKNITDIVELWDDCYWKNIQTREKKITSIKELRQEGEEEGEDDEVVEIISCKVSID